MVRSPLTVSLLLLVLASSVPPALTTKLLIASSAVSGDLTIDGTYNGDVKPLILDGANTTIDGTGTIDFTTSDLELETGNKTISSAASLNLSTGDFALKIAGIKVTNNGSITIADDLTATDATNSWTNAANSTLKIGGVLLASGNLLASAS